MSVIDALCRKWTERERGRIAEQVEADRHIIAEEPDPNFLSDLNQQYEVLLEDGAEAKLQINQQIAKLLEGAGYPRRLEVVGKLELSSRLICPIAESTPEYCPPLCPRP